MFRECILLIGFYFEINKKRIWNIWLQKKKKNRNSLQRILFLKFGVFTNCACFSKDDTFGHDFNHKYAFPVIRRLWLIHIRTLKNVTRKGLVWIFFLKEC